MSADNNSVNYGPTHGAGQADETSSGARERNLSQPGITVSELIAAVGNLEMPGDGFADALEVVQANQGLAEMPEWPDWTECKSDWWIREDSRSRAMKVTDKLTEAELAERLDEVLDRASHGDEFAIERDGEVIALIRPPASNAQPSITWGEFVAKYRDLPRPDDRFADGLEQILAERELMTDGPDWPD